MTEEQAKDSSHFVNKADNTELEVIVSGMGRRGHFHRTAAPLLRSPLPRSTIPLPHCCVDPLHCPTAVLPASTAPPPPYAPCAPQDQVPLIEWLANDYKKFGCALEFVTNKSENGSQFCRGFGGIGGILRYPVDMAQLEADHADDFDDFQEDEEKEDVAWDTDDDFM